MNISPLPHPPAVTGPLLSPAAFQLPGERVRLYRERGPAEGARDRLRGRGAHQDGPVPALCQPRRPRRPGSGARSGAARPERADTGPTLQGQTGGSR